MEIPLEPCYYYDYYFYYDDKVSTGETGCIVVCARLRRSAHQTRSRTADTQYGVLAKNIIILLLISMDCHAPGPDGTIFRREASAGAGKRLNTEKLPRGSEAWLGSLAQTRKGWGSAKPGPSQGWGLGVHDPRRPATER
ncbi:hypothetical protein VTN02DRAFT_3869 [Thermoascus thermophilus]